MSREPIKKLRNDVQVIEANIINESNIAYGCFTTRQKGNSVDPYDSLNLGINTDDDKEVVLSNIQLIRQLEMYSDSKIVCCNQVHGNDVLDVDNFEIQDDITILGNYDGLTTNNPDITLFTYHADCLAIFFLDPVNKAIGLAHGGWKGLVKNIGKTMVDKMAEKYGSQPKDMMAYISPAIYQFCFETGEDVRTELISRYDFAKGYISENENKQGKYYVDLKGICEEQLEECGIINIDVSPRCTHCEEDLFYSYRRERGITGRMGAFLRLR